MAVPQGRIFLGAIVLGIIWLLVVRFQSNLRRFVHRIPLGRAAQFFAVGLFFSDLVMENIAINFAGDLDPNLAVNTFWWLGSCLAWVAGWWVLGQFYRLNAGQVFFVAGLMGVLVEQHWLVPRLVASGQWFTVLAAAPLLVPVYGGAVAPAFLLAPASVQGRRKPGAVGLAVCLVATLAAFYLGTVLWLQGLRPLITA
jgi:hypothetical protein